MTMPSRPVINPPSRKVIQRGKALAKSLAGETTLAAMLTDSVATTTVNMQTATMTGCVNCPTSCTGSQIVLPKMMAEADVMMTPIAAKTTIVVGSATVCPIICSRWLRPKRVKSGMFRLSVDQ